MKKSNKINFKILLLMFFGLFNGVHMEAASNDNCVTTNENITQQTLTIQAQVEKRLQEMYNKLEANLRTQLLQQEDKMQEMYTKLEENLKMQFLLRKINVDIVIQRRSGSSTDFQRTWSEYRKGFGYSVGEYFIGLDKLHKLTNSRRYELLIVMEDWENDRRYAKYDQFVIGSEAEKYALKSLGEYSGTAGDALGYHLGQSFTTKDQDNDDNEDGNCAVDYTGAWWYKHCHQSNLNGLYGKITEYAHGIHWFPFTGNSKTLQYVEMSIRPY